MRVQQGTRGAVRTSDSSETCLNEASPMLSMTVTSRFHLPGRSLGVLVGGYSPSFLGRTG